MDKLWGRLEAWAKKNAKRSLRLKKGASEKQIAAAEKKMKLNFPAAFRASLLLHDGQDAKDDTFEWMPGCSPLASLDAIVEQWVDEQEQVDPDEPKKAVEGGLLWNVLWHPRRVPIAGTPYWDGDNTYLDLHPGPKGHRGPDHHARHRVRFRRPRKELLLRDRDLHRGAGVGRLGVRPEEEQRPPEEGEAGRLSERGRRVRRLCEEEGEKGRKRLKFVATRRRAT